MAELDDLIDDFELIEDWEERYRFLIEIGRRLEPLPDAARTEANKVKGCASQVWLETTAHPDGRLTFRGDSDAHIVRGLVTLTLAIFSGRTAAEIAATDHAAIFDRLGLAQHLTPQRSNGVRAMVDRVKADAGRALAQA
jgi:cysteine desulfuration protein SufE